MAGPRAEGPKLALLLWLPSRSFFLGHGWAAGPEFGPVWSSTAVPRSLSGSCVWMLSFVGPSAGPQCLQVGQKALVWSDTGLWIKEYFGQRKVCLDHGQQQNSGSGS